MQHAGMYKVVGPEQLRDEVAIKLKQAVNLYDD